MLILLGYIQVYLVDLFLLVARLFPIFLFVPFLNSRVLNSQLLKYIIIFYIAMGIRPSIIIIDEIRDEWEVVLLSELVVGIFIGLIFATPFGLLPLLVNLLIINEGLVLVIQLTQPPGLSLRNSRH